MNVVVKLFGMGHSHLRALRMGAELLSSEEAIAVETVSLRDDHYRKLVALNPDEAAARELRARALAADLVFVSISGNAHNMLGLAEPPVPLDFHHPALPQFAIREDVEIVPYRMIRSVFESALSGVRVYYRYLTKLLDRPMFQCEPPPPKASEAFILEHAGSFASMLKTTRVAPASVRMKMWKLQSDVMQAMCKETGIGFLPCPPESLDVDGFLAERLQAKDATHANAHYGALVLRQLAAVARARADVAMVPALS